MYYCFYIFSIMYIYLNLINDTWLKSFHIRVFLGATNLILLVYFICCNSSASFLCYFHLVRYTGPFSITLFLSTYQTNQDQTNHHNIHQPNPKLPSMPPNSRSSLNMSRLKQPHFWAMLKRVVHISKPSQVRGRWGLKQPHLWVVLKRVVHISKPSWARGG